MTVEQCLIGICLFPLDGDGPRIFGFSEFLAGLALMVLAWTIADVRYRFRLETAPIPLLSVTFSIVSTIGVLALLTDLWRAEQWLVPRGNLLTPASWQAILAGLFLLTFLAWAWFAFIRPESRRYRRDPVIASAWAARALATLALSLVKDRRRHEPRLRFSRCRSDTERCGFLAGSRCLGSIRLSQPVVTYDDGITQTRSSPMRFEGSRGCRVCLHQAERSSHADPKTGLGTGLGQP